MSRRQGRAALPFAVAALWAAATPVRAEAEPAAAVPAASREPAAAAREGGLSAEEQRAATQVVNRLINAIRYQKDAVAAAQLGFGPMTEALFGPELWAQMAPEQRERATAQVEVLVRQASFSRGRQVYGYIDAVRFAAAKSRRQGERFVVPSTVVVHRELKKTEMAVSWVLARDGKQLKIVDTLTAGDSLTAGIHEDQVAPLAGKGGLQAVLAALAERATKAAAEAKGGQ